jgi:hypothetical protein
LKFNAFPDRAASQVASRVLEAAGLSENKSMEGRLAEIVSFFGEAEREMDREAILFES